MGTLSAALHSPAGASRHPGMPSRRRGMAAVKLVLGLLVAYPALGLVNAAEPKTEAAPLPKPLPPERLKPPPEPAVKPIISAARDLVGKLKVEEEDISP